MSNPSTDKKKKARHVLGEIDMNNPSQHTTPSHRDSTESEVHDVSEAKVSSSLTPNSVSDESARSDNNNKDMLMREFCQIEIEIKKVHVTEPQRPPSLASFLNYNRDVGNEVLTTTHQEVIVTVIQRWVRRFLSQVHVCRYKTRRILATVVIQKYYRSYISKKRFTNLKLAIIALQCRARRKDAKDLLRSIKKTRKYEQDRARSIRRILATIVIQKYYRSYISKKRFINLKLALIALQCRARQKHAKELLRYIDKTLKEIVIVFNFIDQVEPENHFNKMLLKFNLTVGPDYNNPIPEERCKIIVRSFTHSVDVDKSGVLDRHKSRDIVERSGVLDRHESRDIVERYLIIIFVTILSKYILSQSVIWYWYQKIVDNIIHSQQYETLHIPDVILVYSLKMYETLVYILQGVPGDIWLTLISSILGIVVVPYCILKVTNYLVVLQSKKK